MRSVLSVCCIVLLSLTVTSTPATAATPAIYNLGTLGGNNAGDISWGLGLNNSGQVVGIGSTTNTHERHAFLYTGTPGNGGVMHDLGVLGKWAGSEFSTAYAVNEGGQVVGHSYAPYPPIHAFLYSGDPGSGGSMVDLGTFGLNSYAYDINDSGQIAGASHLPLVPGATDLTYRAFLYTGTPGSGGVMYDLGTLSLFPEHSLGYGINASGQVTGYSGDHLSYLLSNLPYPDDYSNTRAFLYTGTPGSGGLMHDLGVLGGTQSAGFDINDSGQVVGISATPDAKGFHAFLYTGAPGVDGVMHDLGTLGGSGSWANAINAAGHVAGTSDVIGSSLPHAFLYTGTPGIDGQMIDLDAWLDAVNPTEGAKWTLIEAYDLNDHGLITGVGEYNDGPGGLSDGTRAFLLDASSLTVPEAPGDFDHDGDVDHDDLLQWQGDFGQNGFSDADDDGDSDGADFLAWQWHVSGPAVSAASIPEPASLALLALTAPGLLALRSTRAA